ncbi:hypothetical protein PFLUV_G00007460 [Perca fluviatilis]|uniref:Uncharacterized protein n=1 Tax=Perca fluviatilis TaxID=8168 RepID=A0A6A5FQ33_PERFL|nr:hypothetical protein PFLUV_G00007460 [Perca fluviatilis]
MWRALFGKEADKLEKANDDYKTYYIIEKESIINMYISVPNENSTLNCAARLLANKHGVVSNVVTCCQSPDLRERKTVGDNDNVAAPPGCCVLCEL